MRKNSIGGTDPSKEPLAWYKMKGWWIVGGGCVVALICLIPVWFYRKTFNGEISRSNAEWGTLGDYLGGVLNPFISLLTLLVTGYIAYILYKYEKQRDEASKKESDIKSFMELYQFFISPEFRQTRNVAWYVLKKAIYNDRYMDFVVGEHFVARYKNRIDRADVYKEFKKILYLKDHPLIKKPEEKENFLKEEALDRNQVDVLVNFFQLLSFKDVPGEYYKVCDFYYDTWRPVLRYYADKLEKGYKALDLNKQYNNPPSLLASLKELDKRYFKPEVVSALEEESIDNHPIIVHMKSGKR